MRKRGTPELKEYFNKVVKAYVRLKQKEGWGRVSVGENDSPSFATKRSIFVRLRYLPPEGSSEEANVFSLAGMEAELREAGVDLGNDPYQERESVRHSNRRRAGKKPGRRVRSRGKK